METKEMKAGSVEDVKGGPVDEDVKVGPVDEDLRMIRLRTGALMPTLGMGTWHHGPKNEIQDALRYFQKPNLTSIPFLTLLKNITDFRN